MTSENNDQQPASQDAALKEEEQTLRDQVIPQLMAIQQQAAAEGRSADNVMLQLNGPDGDQIPLEEYAKSALFRYAQLLAPQEDRAEKWSSILTGVAETDAFIAGMMAGVAVMNIEEFAADNEINRATLDFSETLLQKRIYVHALDNTICVWLSTQDEEIKTQAKELSGKIIDSWENHQAPEGFPNNAPAACEAFLQTAVQNEQVRPLIEELKPDQDFTPPQEQKSGPPTPPQP